MAQADADELTSEAIFVFAQGGPNVQLGDVLRLTGEVSEFDGLTEITLAAGTLLDCGDLSPPPSRALALPVDPGTPSLSAWERYEGMYVTFPQALRSSEYFNFDRFNELVLCEPSLLELSNALERLFQPTAVDEPESPARAARAEYNARTCITLDDARAVQNPDPARHPNGQPFTLENRFRGSDVV